MANYKSDTDEILKKNIEKVLFRKRKQQQQSHQPSDDPLEGKLKQTTQLELKKKMNAPFFRIRVFANLQTSALG